MSINLNKNNNKDHKTIITKRQVRLEAVHRKQNIRMKKQAREWICYYYDWEL